MFWMTSIQHLLSLRHAPVVLHKMAIGVTDTAVVDIDGHVVGPQGATFNAEGGDTGVGAGGCVGLRNMGHPQTLDGIAPERVIPISEKTRSRTLKNLEHPHIPFSCCFNDKRVTRIR